MNAGLEFLAKIRAAGKKPAHVWITICDEPQQKFWQWPDFERVEIHAPDKPESVRMDWRPIVGCNVILVADKRTPTLRALVERLCGMAATMTVSVVAELPDNHGHLFVRDRGWRAI